MAGVDAEGAELIRDGANVMYRLTGGIVARIGPDGSRASAVRQVEVAQWLSSQGIPVVRALSGVPQPTMVEDRPVTWWELLPPHRPATPRELGGVLRLLHTLTPPVRPELPEFDPFAGLDERISAAHHLPDEDRSWLTHHASDLRAQLHNLPRDATERVIHGDAWQGNVAVPESCPPILLDLDHVSRGHPDWDLIPIAVDYTDFARLTSADYHDFVTGYGTDAQWAALTAASLPGLFPDGTTGAATGSPRSVRPSSSAQMIWSEAP
ncbi:aminoglycoside phosphotransferase family protein [Amycolatopsis cynarae]|uniref:Aminoglycoside phosphotransferase family protein n=1 Tax=Amycolatopsis cynarae TaxID=2995223 RepID=A0ABY7B904_9PSEU|nr:aminoglycoside phosphotransferase family protein [Amycolatopsis sp. HUAS 11-8]WAL68830.1 aminoglycoside phosphotransferase family protein [Amycolatopsis sp. HUAS 11-8]